MKLQDVVQQIEIDTKKLTDYALCPSHPQGKNKAYVFEKVLGYNLSNYSLLLLEIQDKALSAEVEPKLKDQHGARYQTNIEITGANDDQAVVVIAWIVEPIAPQIAKLITLRVSK
ncbi:MAG: hypothetical protein RIS84_1123 [Pseudomonadota bacterium]|jgi:filamentous hemagglutinin